MPYQNEILGGVLLGLASALPLLFEGRIAGISAYASMSLRPKTADGRLSLIFILGIILGGLIWRLIGASFPDISGLNLSTSAWIVAGLLVGFGSRLSGGCTSGHGICGLGRISPRSITSVVIFMSTAILTSFLMRLFL